jgi:hypothetical protein
MKLPLEFATKFVFRLLLPGAALAAAMVPLVHWVMQKCGVGVKVEYLFPFEVIAWGWLITVGDMSIYMLFEGRRYWPPFLRRWMLAHEEKRLATLEKERERYVRSRDSAGDSPIAPETLRRYLEAMEEYRRFPRDADGNFLVRYPTRLGNLIASYEEYPTVSYGIDVVFYWYRLWVVLDKDLREELDNAQAFVDGTVYVPCVLLISSLMMFFYAGIELVGQFVPLIAVAINIPYVPSTQILAMLGVACIASSWCLYRFSLHAHAHYGDLFRAVFDQYRAKLVLDDTVQTVADITCDPTLPYRLSRSEKYTVVRRYLEWGQIRDESEKRNKQVGEWKRGRKQLS